MNGIKNFIEKYKYYIISVAIALGIGLLSTLITMGNMELFDDIRKPTLSPPAFLFPIAWTVLYVLMGISAARIYEIRMIFKNEADNALAYYAASLVVNFAWSIIFFNFKAFFLALLWILLLLFLIIKTVLCYRKIDKVAAYLQIPYIIWVSFATYLTFGIWLMN